MCFAKEIHPDDVREAILAHRVQTATVGSIFVNGDVRQGRILGEQVQRVRRDAWHQL
jgi:hypothetical protein